MRETELNQNIYFEILTYAYFWLIPNFQQIEKYFRNQNFLNHQLEKQIWSNYCLQSSPILFYWESILHNVCYSLKLQNPFLWITGPLTRAREVYMMRWNVSRRPTTSYLSLFITSACSWGYCNPDNLLTARRYTQSYTSQVI